MDIFWTVSGKVSRINKPDTKISFQYDALGNRLSKTEANAFGSNKTTYYFRDAQGNVLSNYKRDWNYNCNSPFDNFYLTEQDIYGSSRLGLQASNLQLHGLNWRRTDESNASDATILKAYENKEYDAFSGIVLDPYNSAYWTDDKANFSFDENNHLTVKTAFNFLKYPEQNAIVQIYNFEKTAQDSTRYSVKFDLQLSDGMAYPKMEMIKTLTDGNQTKLTYLSEKGFKESDFEISTDVYFHNFEQQKCEVTLSVNKTTLYEGKGLIRNQFNETVSDNNSLPKFYIGQNAEIANFGLLMKYLNYDINKQTKEFYFETATKNPVSKDESITMQYSRVAAMEYIDIARRLIFYQNKVGDKRYELSNHLGNVLSVVSDRKLINFETRGIPVLTATMEDGNLQPFIATTTNTDVSTTKGTLQITAKERGQGVKTPVSFEENKIYNLTFDIEAENYKGLIEIALRNEAGEAIYKELIEKTNHYAYTLKGIPTGNYHLTYENTEGEGIFALDNIALIDITAVPEFPLDDMAYLAENAIFVPDVLSYNDYYPFGMLIPGRHEASGSYRYGFNGKEKDDEIKGGGVQYDYGFRIYDARISRFLSVDPLASSYPWYTPFQFAGNKPIRFIDLDGLEEHDPFFESPEFQSAVLISETAWGVYEAVGDAMLWVLEVCVSDEKLGSVHRKMLEEKGVVLSSEITNEQLADMFELKKDGREVVQQFSNGFWPSAANAGLGLLQILSVAYPGSSPQTFFAKTGLKMVAIQSGKFLMSNAGLLYGLGSRHGNRLSHVLEHTVNLLNRQGKHGVFKVDDVFGTIDEAWNVAKSIDPKAWNKSLQVGQSETVDGITRSLRSNLNGEIYESFTVDMKKIIGYEGGAQGSGEDLTKIIISVKQGTEEVITAFPTK